MSIAPLATPPRSGMKAAVNGYGSPASARTRSPTVMRQYSSPSQPVKGASVSAVPGVPGAWSVAKPYSMQVGPKAPEEFAGKFQGRLLQRLADAEAAAVKSGVKASTSWIATNNFEIGPVGCESLFEGKAALLDRSTYDSVNKTSCVLNSHRLPECDTGYCVVFSKSQQKYYLMWRADKELAALKALRVEASSSTASGVPLVQQASPTPQPRRLSSAVVREPSPSITIHSARTWQGPAASSFVAKGMPAVTSPTAYSSPTAGAKPRLSFSVGSKDGNQIEEDSGQPTGKEPLRQRSETLSDTRPSPRAAKPSTSSAASASTGPKRRKASSVADCEPTKDTPAGGLQSAPSGDSAGDSAGNSAPTEISNRVTMLIAMEKEVAEGRNLLMAEYHSAIAAKNKAASEQAEAMRGMASLKAIASAGGDKEKTEAYFGKVKEQLEEERAALQEEKAALAKSEAQVSELQKSLRDESVACAKAGEDLAQARYSLHAETAACKAAQAEATNAQKSLRDAAGSKEIVISSTQALQRSLEETAAAKEKALADAAALRQRLELESHLQIATNANLQQAKADTIELEQQIADLRENTRLEAMAFATARADCKRIQTSLTEAAAALDEEQKGAAQLQQRYWDEMQANSRLKIELVDVRQALQDESEACLTAQTEIDRTRQLMSDATVARTHSEMQASQSKITLEAELEAVTRTKSELFDVRQALHAETAACAHAQSSCAKFQDALRNAEANAQKLEHVIESAELAEAEAQADVVESRRRLQEEAHRCLLLSVDLEKAREDLETETQTLAHARADAAQTEQAVSDVTAAVAAANADAEKLQESLHQETTALAESQAEVSSLQEDLQSQIETCRQSQNSVAKLREECVELVSAEADAKEQVAALQQSLLDRSSEVTQNETELNNLRGLLQAKTEACEHVTAELKHAECELASVESGAAAQVAELMQSLLEKSAACTQHQAEVSKLEDSLAAEAEKCISMEASVEQAEQALSTMTAAEQSAKSDIAELQESLLEETKACSKAMSEVMKLRQSLRQRTGEVCIGLRVSDELQHALEEARADTEELSQALLEAKTARAIGKSDGTDSEQPAVTKMLQDEISACARAKANFAETQKLLDIERRGRERAQEDATAQTRTAERLRDELAAWTAACEKAQKESTVWQQQVEKEVAARTSAQQTAQQDVSEVRRELGTQLEEQKQALVDEKANAAELCRRLDRSAQEISKLQDLLQDARLASSRSQAETEELQRRLEQQEPTSSVHDAVQRSLQLKDGAHAEALRFVQAEIARFDSEHNHPGAVDGRMLALRLEEEVQNTESSTATSSSTRCKETQAPLTPPVDCQLLNILADDESSEERKQAALKFWLRLWLRPAHEGDLLDSDMERLGSSLDDADRSHWGEFRRFCSPVRLRVPAFEDGVPGDISASSTTHDGASSSGSLAGSGDASGSISNSRSARSMYGNPDDLLVEGAFQRREQGRSP